MRAMWVMPHFTAFRPQFPIVVECDEVERNENSYTFIKLMNKPSHICETHSRSRGWP